MSYADVEMKVVQWGEALLQIVHRAVTTKRFVPTAEQIKALQNLMELHDAQMDVITIKDMERALGYWVGLALLGWLIWVPLLYLLLRE